MKDRATSWAIGLVLLLAPLSACSSTPTVLEREHLDLAEGPAAPPTFEYRLGPGDVLRVNVYLHPELGSEVYRNNTLGSPVDGSGQIALPLIGEVPVNGLTVAEVRAGVEQLLREYIKEPRVDVSVLEYGAHRIFVVGEVRNPGAIVLDRPMNALEALALTGGFTPDANRSQIALVRGDLRPDNLVLLNADDLDPAGRLPLRTGDMIFVGRRYWAGVSQVARDLVPILQAISLPISTARDVAIFQDLVNN